MGVGKRRVSVWSFLLLVSVAAASLLLVDGTRAEDAGAGDELIGEWWTENNEGRVSFARYKDGTYRGTTTCCAHRNDPNNPDVDRENPNPARRTRSTLGIVLIWGLKFEDSEWVGGHVYNPRDGKTYRMKIARVDHETIKIRGYMGIALLGQTQIWKRAHLDASKQPAAVR